MDASFEADEVDISGDADFGAVTDADSKLGAYTPGNYLSV